MPPLRERPEDIPLLAAHFIRLSSSHGTIHVTGLRPDALALLQQHRWPGNVRELKARIDRAILFAKSRELTSADFSLESHTVAILNTAGVKAVNKLNTTELPTLAEVERHYIQHVLKSTHGNISQAARSLGINRVTLYKRMAEYEGI
jgi:DNA-binding NtrC family response regulator